MSSPQVVAVAPGSPADAAGIVVGDEIVTIDGQVPRDVIQYRLLVDGEDPELEVRRGGVERNVVVAKADGTALGVEVQSAVFDRVRTCDNHCEFCFIYQLPKGLRRSLYVKDDDYRLSFLYGNFTTLTRFTESDFERVLTEGLSPLYVSIHSTDPELRARMLRNRRGATSLRWLKALLDHGVEVHGQLVVCPGINDGAALDDTLAGVLDEYPQLASLAVVPLGVSRFNTEPAMRPHTVEEAEYVVDAVTDWQDAFVRVLGRRVVFAADEYYLLAGRPFPAADTYEGFAMHEDGIGMARAFEAELLGDVDEGIGIRTGFFSAVDGAPAEGYRAHRLVPIPVGPVLSVSSGAHSGPKSPKVHPGPVATAILTGTYGARVLRPLLDRLGRDDVRVVEVTNDYFGGNVGVAGLMVGADLDRVLRDEPDDHRYLLPDVCLTNGVFLDGTKPDDLPRPVEIVATDGVSLRRALGTAAA
jgi:putative radical SAM enzyme (TIGR03279 family)